MRDSPYTPPSVPCPAEEARSYIRFLRIYPDTTYRLAIASARVWACMTHWIDGRTRYCPQDKGDCPYCREGIEDRWMGFLAVYQRGLSLPVLFDFYRPPYVHCPLLQANDGQLQRAVIEVRRLGPSRNSPLAITWTGRREEGIPTPVELPHRYLERLWNVDMTGGEAICG